ncbi:LEPR-XLL domain-containing protein [Calycomorphotria hydatis]|uniref:Uncharacterized protein n=1 Tax=Calycomorphotria hydatis TaxID=2528027 RepID=A0A517TA47_9PLAN|nr:LEPR-XLL domain-containing protein [Calycomorphotria hydatis]QDT65247.1 hypothetical protein V22_24940 [Calycomorphotria hydatis]
MVLAGWLAALKERTRFGKTRIRRRRGYTAPRVEPLEQRVLLSGTDVSIGDLRFGVAVEDDTTGTGFLMYSEEGVDTRFSPGLYPENSEHILAVRHDGTNWEYNNNNSWYTFTTDTTDRLLAEVDFTNDTVTSLQGTEGSYEGLALGYESGDLSFAPNMFNGGFNLGEFGVTGTTFHINDPVTVTVGNLGYGVAVDDEATGVGYLMYSAEAVNDRFPVNPFADNAEHIVAVRFDGTNWEYNTNNANWYVFTPRSDDRLLAEVDFTNDTLTSFEGTEDTYEGIARGYLSGDLAFHVNKWNGGTNAGEFGVTGTNFTVNSPVVAPVGNVTTSVGNLAYGVAVQDDATGTGYLMYSAEAVDTRFPAGVFANNSEQLVAVRFTAPTGNTTTTPPGTPSPFAAATACWPRSTSPTTPSPRWPESKIITKG